ncbi:LysR family transcriptional regulator [uncultured Arcticibacterium sp.]|uniref:winged helix-turn-helix domain-containing protein n=1 Tax=uncultured Arcticibacterium sp. TaxID=2173042 RepID=UPI0030FBF634
MNLGIKSRFWIESENEKFLGSGRVELLEKIDRLGSISKAAAEMKMAYRKAWGLIKSMNELSDKPLVIKQTGGKHGGGTVVTTEGKKAIILYKEFEEDLNFFLESRMSKLKL